MNQRLAQPIARSTFVQRVKARALPKALRSVGVSWMVHRLRSGELVRFPTNSILAENILLEDRFEPTVQNAMRNYLSPGMTALDLGANLGYYSLQMATIVGTSGKVVAFEPNPVVRKQLEHNVALNQLGNVLIMPIAVSDGSGTATFCFPKPGYEAHGSLHDNTSFQTVSRADVDTETLDRVLESLGSPIVHFVKIDVEGAELSVFRGARRLLSSARKPVIVFEAAEDACAGFGHRVFDVLQCLAGYGYVLTHLQGANWLAE